MDFLKIAARVAAEPTGVVAGGGNMTVGQLIAELSKADPNAEASVSVEGPKETATGTVVAVKGGHIRAVPGSEADDEPEEDPGPPSDPGSPYDTLEEKRGLK
jgi:hypothetical protein